VGHYSDAETDQLIADAVAGVVAGELTQEQIDAILAQVGPVDLSNYYDKPEVDAKVAALQQGVNDAELSAQSVADQLLYVAEQLATQLGDQIKLKADQATTYTKDEVDAAIAAIPVPEVDLTDYYTKPEVDAAIAAIPATDLAGYAKTEDLPIVYEQDAEPVAKDGDLWLGPAAETAPTSPMPEADIAREVQKVIDARPKTLTEPEVREIVRSMIAGGKEPPPDFDWTPLVFVQGTGQIDAKLTNGVIVLRGTLVFTYTSGGTFTTVRTLPARLPKPTVPVRAVVTGKENGVAFRFVSVTLTTGGDLQICANGGKVTHIDFDGMTAYVC